MSFVNGDFQEAVDSPEDLCPEKLGGLLAAFPPVPLVNHERGGFRFTPPPCGQALALDPDFCISTVKADPQGWRPERDALVSAIQSAVECSLGVTDEELKREAKAAIDQNLSRAIEADLVAELAAEALPQGTGLSATCALADAAMFLAASGACPTGVIIGPVDWFTALTKESLIWNGKYHTDVNGNLVLSHSVDNATIYAFDSNVIIKVSEITLLDEHMPGQRERNDRVVRAELVYAIAMAPCVVGSWTFTCCDCASGGGGGGGGNVTVTNFPANQSVTVSNFPAATPEFDTEIIVLCDDNGPFLRRFTYDESTGLPTTTVTTDLSGAVYVPVGVVHDCAGNETDVPISTISVTSHHFNVVSGSPWTPAAIPAGRLIGLSHTVVVDTVTVVDSDGTSIAGIPTGFTQNWNVQDDRETLTPVQSITADTAIARSIVTMVVGTP